FDFLQAHLKNCRLGFNLRPSKSVSTYSLAGKLRLSSICWFLYYIVGPTYVAILFLISSFAFQSRVLPPWLRSRLRLNLNIVKIQGFYLSNRALEAFGCPIGMIRLLPRYYVACAGVGCKKHFFHRYEPLAKCHHALDIGALIQIYSPALTIGSKVDSIVFEAR
ncbi:unnamed protein product, partial [Ilex paraguariensis]